MTRPASLAGGALFALGLAAFLTIGCHGITTPSNNQNETFSGTLTPQGSNSHRFSVAKTGEFTVKLTAWGPNANLFTGVAWTTANADGSCAGLLQQNNFVVLNTQALGGSIVSGKSCIVIFDLGTLTAAQTYTLSVSHP